MKTHDDYQFWVCILSNRSHVLYIGLTNSLRRLTAKYKITRLVHCEQF